MSFRSDDERKLLREFTEWLYTHEWLVTSHQEGEGDQEKRKWLVDEFVQEREIK